MACKLKTVVLFLQIVTNFLPSRPFGKIIDPLSVDYSATTSQKKTTTTTTAIVLGTLNFDAKDCSIHAMYSIEDKLFVSFPCPVIDCKCSTIIAETFSVYSSPFIIVSRF